MTPTPSAGPSAGPAATQAPRFERFRPIRAGAAPALVAGHGVPFVFVPGITADASLYARTLATLVPLGFKVIALDIAGHGGGGVPTRDGLRLAAYGELVERAVDEFGIRRAVYAGHSMGGRLVSDLAARRPDRVVAVVLVDAIVGDTWDRMVTAARRWPPLLGPYTSACAVDILSTVSVSDRTQAAELLRLWGGGVTEGLTRPWNLLAPFLAVMRSAPSAPALDAIRAAGVPVTILHGDHDRVAPIRAAHDTRRRTGGHLEAVEGGGHAWLLKDPGAFGAVMAGLLRGHLGDAVDAAMDAAAVAGGLDPATATAADPYNGRSEAAFYEPTSVLLGR